MSTVEEINTFIKENNLTNEEKMRHFKNFLRTKKDGVPELINFKTAEL